MCYTLLKIENSLSATTAQQLLFEILETVVWLCYISQTYRIANVSILKIAKIVENHTFSGRVFCISNFTKNKIL